MTALPEHPIAAGFGTPSPEQLVFYWMPVEGRRHAIRGAHGAHHPGEQAGTLCGQEVVARAASEHEWIRWATCDECWAVAKNAQDALNRR